jgi:uncharacterized protein
MYYNVAQLLKEPVGSTRSYGVDEPGPNADGATGMSPCGRVSLMRTDKGIWVNASVEAPVWVSCSRCLKGFPYPVGIVIEEEYLPTVDVTTGQSLAVPERAEGSFTIDPKHTLDLGEAVRQYTLASQPMKPLCSQDCQGLCPACGVDRNENHCSCGEGDIDPRLGPLLELLKTDSR